MNMGLLYVFLILIVIPLVGIVIGNLIIDNWDKIRNVVCETTKTIFALIVLSLLIFLFFKCCGGCDERGKDNIDHIHFEKI